MTYIYLVENCYGDPNKVYIGKTKNSRSRELDHKKNFGNETIYTIIDKTDSLEYEKWEPLETYWIEQFKSWGFNLINKRKKGGSGPSYRTDEDKVNIGKHNMVPKPGVSHKLKGRKSFHKEDTGKKISETKRGSKQSDEWKINRSKAMKGKQNRLGTRFPNGYKKRKKDA